MEAFENGGWRDRNGELQTYWAGGRPSTGCQCGTLRSCTGNTPCNCVGTEASDDDGYITEPTKLPITVFLSPFLSTTDPSHLTVDPMACFGNRLCADPINNIHYHSLGLLYQENPYGK